MKFFNIVDGLDPSVCSASASDFDKVLNTVVSNNMAPKYADAEKSGGNSIIEVGKHP